MTSEEIKKAMINFSPIKYKDVTYKRICAYTYRVIETSPKKYKTVFQVELLDRNKNSRTLADPDMVELVEGVS